MHQQETAEGWGTDDMATARSAAGPEDGGAETQVLARLPDLHAPPIEGRKETKWARFDGRILSQGLSLKLLVGGAVLLILAAIIPHMLKKGNSENYRYPAPNAGLAPPFAGGPAHLPNTQPARLNGQPAPPNNTLVHRKSTAAPAVAKARQKQGTRAKKGPLLPGKPAAAVARGPAKPVARVARSLGRPATAVTPSPAKQISARKALGKQRNSLPKLPRQQADRQPEGLGRTALAPPRSQGGGSNLPISAVNPGQKPISASPPSRSVPGQQRQMPNATWRPPNTPQNRGEMLPSSGPQGTISNWGGRPDPSPYFTPNSVRPPAVQGSAASNPYAPTARYDDRFGANRPGAGYPQPNPTDAWDRYRHEYHAIPEAEYRPTYQADFRAAPPYGDRPQSMRSPLPAGPGVARFRGTIVTPPVRQYQ